MKNIFFLAITLQMLGCLTLHGCKAEDDSTIIQGKVIDGNTGQPVDLAEVLFSSHPKSDDGFHQVTDHTILTDVGGNFTIEVTPEIELTGSFTFRKNGYNSLIKWDFNFKENETNDIVIHFWKQNSWLKLSMRNSLVQDDSLFISLSNKTVYPQIFPGNIQDFPVMLTFGEERTSYFPFSYGTYTTIKWGTSLGMYQQHATLDSILMPDLDTIDFIINY